jgi:hypothetical protein
MESVREEEALQQASRAAETAQLAGGVAVEQARGEETKEIVPLPFEPDETWTETDRAVLDYLWLRQGQTVKPADVKRLLPGSASQKNDRFQQALEKIKKNPQLGQYLKRDRETAARVYWFDLDNPETPSQSTDPKSKDTRARGDISKFATKNVDDDEPPHIAGSEKPAITEDIFKYVMGEKDTFDPSIFSKPRLLDSVQYGLKICLYDPRYLRNDECFKRFHEVAKELKYAYRYSSGRSSSSWE